MVLQESCVRYASDEAQTNLGCLSKFSGSLCGASSLL